LGLVGSKPAGGILEHAEIGPVVADLDGWNGALQRVRVDGVLILGRRVVDRAVGVRQRYVELGDLQASPAAGRTVARGQKQ